MIPLTRNVITDDDVKNNSFLRDFNLFLEYAKEKGIKLTEKKNVSPKEIKIINDLFVKKEILEGADGGMFFRFRGEDYSHYFSKFHFLARTAHLIRPKFNKIIISKNNHLSFCNLGPAEQYEEMFNLATQIQDSDCSWHNYENEVNSGFLNGFFPLILCILSKLSKDVPEDSFVSFDAFLKELKKYIDLEKIWCLIEDKEDSFTFTDHIIKYYFERILNVLDIIELKRINFYIVKGWKLSSFGKKFIDKYLRYQQEIEEFPNNSAESNIDLFNHDKNYCYYEGMECLNMGNIETALMWLYQAVILDEYYVEAYVGLASLYGMVKNVELQRKNILRAFEITMYKLPFLEKNISWGIIENRQYLRALENMALIYSIDNNIKDAEEIYRLILKLNPSDNQGVRYYLAGLYEGLSPEKIDLMFEDGDKKQNWSDLENLVKRQNKIHNFF